MQFIYMSAITEGWWEVVGGDWRRNTDGTVRANCARNDKDILLIGDERNVRMEAGKNLNAGQRGMDRRHEDERVVWSRCTVKRAEARRISRKLER